jgi:ClpP class serine protease
LTAPDDELFSGAFWSAARAREHGLIDGIADLRSKMQALHGKKVRLKAVPMATGGLLSRFRRLPGFQWSAAGGGYGLAPSFADDALSAIEARALWSRYGL